MRETVGDFSVTAIHHGLANGFTGDAFVHRGNESKQLMMISVGQIFETAVEACQNALAIGVEEAKKLPADYNPAAMVRISR